MYIKQYIIPCKSYLEIKQSFFYYLCLTSLVGDSTQERIPGMSLMESVLQCQNIYKYITPTATNCFL